MRIVAGVVGVLVVATGAWAGNGEITADLTGTYEGKFKCQWVNAPDGSTDSAVTNPSTVQITRITSAGNTGSFAASIDGVLYSLRTIDQGSADNGRGKGVGAFVLCGSDDDAYLGNTEIEAIKFNVDANAGTGKIKKSGIFNYAGGPDSGTLGTCQGKWKRVDTADPGVQPCP